MQVLGAALGAGVLRPAVGLGDAGGLTVRPASADGEVDRDDGASPASRSAAVQPASTMPASDRPPAPTRHAGGATGAGGSGPHAADGTAARRRSRRVDGGGD